LIQISGFSPQWQGERFVRSGTGVPFWESALKLIDEDDVTNRYPIGRMESRITTVVLSILATKKLDCIIIFLKNV